MTVRDVEVIDLLADKPELLAIADAVSATQPKPVKARRGRSERQHDAPVPVHRRAFGLRLGARRLVSLGAAVAVAAAAALFVTAPWTSSAPPSWSPDRMEEALRAFDVKLVGVITTTDHFASTLRFHADEEVTSAHCRGLGLRTHSGYAFFRCRLVYHDRSVGLAGPYKGSYWARPWTASTVCVSNVSRGTCPPPLPTDPARGDPRKCMEENFFVTGDWHVRCIAATAKQVATKRQGVTYKRCIAGAVWTTYTCNWKGGRATVKFIRHPHSWTTSVTSR
jgi:hypothetical protein